MSITKIILHKVFVREFYRANASFFLLIIGLAGGFMRSYDHIALAEFFISSWFLLLIPITIWFLYTLKIINFNQEILSRSEHEFVFHFSLLSKKEQWISLLIASFNLLMPAFVYGIFLIALALKYKMLITVFLVVSSLILLLFLLATRLMTSLHNPNPDKKSTALNRFINNRFTKPYPLFFIEWIIRREPLMLIGTMLFSSVILFGVLKLYTTDEYDFRLLGIGLVVVAGTQVQLIFLAHQFDNFHFTILKQLPIPIWKRIGAALTTQLFLMLPVVGVLITYFPSNLPRATLVEGLSFIIGGLIFWNGLLYQKDRDLDGIVKLVFAFSILMLILILFKISLLLLAALNILAGVYWWWRYYYRFEYISR